MNLMIGKNLFLKKEPSKQGFQNWLIQMKELIQKVLKNSLLLKNLK